ncbi:DNA polymerase III subunit delta' [Spongiibacter sp.]|uniref:DNA polymerase III subunit delta' n=1 Tax=Spongiibacter sp. TaxID=2024860 RepID=UPI0035673FFD
MTGIAMSYPWQMPQWQQMASLYEGGRFPHALLLGGPEGIGKLRFARALLCSLLCEQPRAFLACGSCSACALHKSGTHPDVRELSPEEGKRQIAVDQVRALQQFTGQSAHRSGGRKLVLIHPAEAMNPYTANALLKTLEEPAGDTVLVLLSHSPSQLLATIRSRCLQLSFPLPERALAVQWLETQLGRSADAAKLLDEAGGRPLAAQQLFETDGLSQWQAQDAALNEVLKGGKTALQLADDWQDREALQILDWWLRRQSELIRHLCADQPLQDSWQAFRHIPLPQLYTLHEQALLLRATLLRGAALNKRLLLEKLLLDWFACAAGRAPQRAY